LGGIEILNQRGYDTHGFCSNHYNWYKQQGGNQVG
jgi:hypothetical protein